jgi:hypothetical protein
LFDVVRQYRRQHQSYFTENALMATSMNAPFTSEIWHLSIDDLLAPMTESPRLGGPGPFVINLSASSAPLSQPAKAFNPPAGALVYQIQRTEDRRPRYRLRLGPFLTEDEADAVLVTVREVYPSALTATAESDDLRAIAALHPKPETPRAPAAPPPTAAKAALRVPGTPPHTAAPVASPAAPFTGARVAPPVVPLTAAPAAGPAAASNTAPPPGLAAPLTAAPPAAAAPRTAPPTAPIGNTAGLRPIRSQPAPPAVSRLEPLPAMLSIPVLSDSVEPVRRTAAPVSTSPPAAAGATTRSPAAANPAPNTRALPNIESTQTLRALSASELQNSTTRWYVIQLSLSGESFDPDSLPNLDIFNEYRLYSVAGLDQGRIVHALRLGFFAEEGAAAAVASYLAGFYEKPTVKRISVAERERFGDQRVEARKDIGATGRHAVIEITGERHVRDNRLRIATVTPLAPAASSAQSMGTPARRGK